MRISGVHLDLIELAAEQPVFRWRDGLPGSDPDGVGGILRIETDTGVVGRAPTRRGVIVADLVDRRIREVLVGEHPLYRERIWQRLWDLDRRESFPSYVIGLVDIALWDLAGQATGLPVYQLIGAARDRIPAYASLVTYSSVEEHLDVVDQCLAAGYRAIKIHGWGDPDEDRRLCTQLREHVGAATPLMYDGSAAFDLGDAIRLGAALADAGYTWFEEPMREHSITAYQRLAERVEVPLLVGETSVGAHLNIADFIAAGCAPYVRTGATHKAGITGALRIAHLADAYQMRAEVHGMGPVSQQLCAAIRNTTYYESRVSGNPIITETAVGPDGFLTVDARPGIGWAGHGVREHVPH